MKVKVPFIEQMSAAECGITCVAMILRYYKSYNSLQELREYLDTGRDGSSIFQLTKLCEKFGLETKTFKGSADDLFSLKFPIIVFSYESHYIIVEKIGRKYVNIVDPKSGSEKITLEQFKDIYSGYAIQITKGFNFKPKKREEYIFRDLASIIKERRYSFGGIFLSSLCIYALSLSIPILMKCIIDDLSLNLYSDSKILTYILLLGVFVTTLIGYFQNFLLINYRTYIDYRISSKIVDKLLDVSYHFFEMRRKSDLIMTINSGYVIREMVAQQLMNGIIDFGAIIFMTIYIYNQSKIICMVSIILFIINTVYLAWSRPKLLNENRQLINKRSEVEGQQVEIIYSMLGIKMAGLEKHIYNSWNNKQTSYLNKHKQVEQFKNNITSFTILLSKISPFIIFAISINMFINNKITLGSVMAFYSLGTTFFNLSSSVSNVYNSYVNSTVYLDRIHDI